MADESTDSEALLSEVMNRDPAPAPEPTPEAVPEKDTPTRDENGRFASKTPTEVPEIEANPAPAAAAPAEGAPEAGMVPQQALHEARQQAKQEREARERAEQRLQALEQRQPPQPAPPETPKREIWDDPEAWGQEQLAPLHREMQTQKLTVSRLVAEGKFGDEVVAAADNALGEFGRANPVEAKALAQQIAASPHPWGALVAWHKDQQARARVGSDPDAFVSAEIDKMLADPAKLEQLRARIGAAVAPGNPAPSRPSIPPSLSHIGGGATSSGAEDASSEALMARVLNRG